MHTEFLANYRSNDRTGELKVFMPKKGSKDILGRRYYVKCIYVYPTNHFLVPKMGRETKSVHFRPFKPFSHCIPNKRSLAMGRLWVYISVQKNCWLSVSLQNRGELLVKSVTDQYVYQDCFILGRIFNIGNIALFRDIENIN